MSNLEIVCVVILLVFNVLVLLTFWLIGKNMEKFHERITRLEMLAIAWFKSKEENK